MAGIGVCIDIYGFWTEAGLQVTIERTISRCGLVQLSDDVYGDRSLPSRAVPGDGAIGIRRFLATMLSARYGGAFDLELLGPRIDREGHFDASVGNLPRREDSNGSCEYRSPDAACRAAAGFSEAV